MYRYALFFIDIVDLSVQQILGVIENMSGFVCPKCSEVHEIFGKGGAKQTALNMGIDFLGEVCCY